MTRTKLLFFLTSIFTVTFLNAQVQKGSDIDGETSYDQSGTSVSMPDIYTVAIGAPFNNGSANSSGHVRVYNWDDGGWMQKGPDIDGESASDLSGYSVSMPNANTIAIGAFFNDNSIGNQPGHVRVFTWSGSSWDQKGVDIDGEADGDKFGHAVVMPDINTVGIGGYHNAGNGNEAGHVRIFTWDGNAWVQKGADIDGEAPLNYCGWSISMPDANTVAIGSPWNSSNGIYSGNVRIFTWNGNAWTQKGANITGAASNNHFGWAVSMPDVNTVAVGAPYNSSNGNGSGHVRIYSWNGNAWTQKGNDINGEADGDHSGHSVSMPNANTIAIGAPQNDGNGNNSGHVRVYKWNGNSWINNSADINGEAAEDLSGHAVSMPDPDIVAIGAPFNSDNGDHSGHVRVYTFAPLASGTSETAAGIRLYPNPTSGELHIDTGGLNGELHVSLTNALGQEVFNRHFPAAQSIACQLEGAPGIYFVTLSSENTQLSRIRIIKR